jgi:peptidoglycan/LPS O-acetylase OafA/YrhL
VTETKEGNAGAGAMPKVLPLTALRFFAALYVVFHHTLRGTFAGITDATVPGLFLRFGFSSVTLFFILSGYILAMVYLRGGQAVDARRFWAARFARIYPLYFATLVLDLPNLLLYRAGRYGARAAVVKTAVTFAGNCLLLQEWIPKLHGLDFPNWSIPVEAVFYLLFPFLGMWLWRRRLRTAVTAVGAWWLGEWALSVFGGPHHLNPFAYLGPLWAVYLFAGGIVLARVHLWLAGNRAGRKRLASAAPGLAVGSVAVFAGCVLASPRIPESVFPNLLLLPIFLPILLAFAAGNGWIERLFSSRALVLLGEASFGLYLLHVPVWAWFFGRLGVRLTVWTYLVYLGLAIGLSIVSFLYFETPARRFLMARLSARSRELEPVASLAQ